MGVILFTKRILFFMFTELSADSLKPNTCESSHRAEYILEYLQFPDESDQVT